MTKCRPLFVAALAAIAAAPAGSEQTVAGPQPPGITRTDLQRHDLSMKGWETVQARIDIAPGALAPAHTHPGEEVIYIIEGELEYRIGDKPWVKVKTGDVLFVPDGVVHAARNRSSANGAELATYVVRKGKPLLSLSGD
jgi:quercetin dioxygenase-like cupin family protein